MNIYVTDVSFLVDMCVFLKVVFHQLQVHIMFCTQLTVILKKSRITTTIDFNLLECATFAGISIHWISSIAQSIHIYVYPSGSIPDHVPIMHIIRTHTSHILIIIMIIINIIYY